VGDDGMSMPFPARMVEKLRVAADLTPTYFMHGNRDFLVAQAFAQASGVRLLEDPGTVDLYGRKALLMHGDTLCTDDVEYQAFRKQVRNPAWQRAALAQPIAARVAMAQGLRGESNSAKQQKSAEIMDVAGPAVEEAFRACGCDLLIHGHTHRPMHHVHEVDGRRCERWVLADWYERGSYLEASPAGLRAVSL
jgi:UDP-2,3-diacylglucosamine hydrolase